MGDHATNSGFRYSRRVGWGDCDPACIAYSGRIPDFALEAIDAFWEHHLDGDGWFQLNIDRGIGTPFVHIEIDVRKPITPRHPLICEVIPKRLGSTSMTFEVIGSQGSQQCFKGNFVCVFVTSGEFKKIEVPEIIRRRLREKFEDISDNRDR